MKGTTVAKLPHLLSNGLPEPDLQIWSMMIQPIRHIAKNAHNQQRANNIHQTTDNARHQARVRLHPRPIRQNTKQSTDTFQSNCQC